MGSHFCAGLPFQTKGLEQFRKMFIKKKSRHVILPVLKILLLIYGRLLSSPCVGRTLCLEGGNFCKMNLTSAVAMNNYGL